MFTKSFVIASAERALKSAAQAGIAFLTTDVTGLLDVDFGQAASVAGLMALLSVLTSIASDAVTSRPGPSLVSAEVLDPTV